MNPAAADPYYWIMNSFRRLLRDPIALRCVLAGLVSVPAYAQGPSEPAAIAQAPIASDTVAHDSSSKVAAAPSDTSRPTAQAPVEEFAVQNVAAQAPPALATAPPSLPARTEHPVRATWLLTLDLGDVDGFGEFNRRHFHQYPAQTNACCLDLGWFPIHFDSGSASVGAFANAGGWHQILTDGSDVTVADLALGASALGTKSLAPIGVGWIRLDLGVSNLLVQRNTTGMDWGLACAARLGITRPVGPWKFFLGAGVDFRRYLNLDVHDIPVLTLFLGEWF